MAPGFETNGKEKDVIASDVTDGCYHSISSLCQF